LDDHHDAEARHQEARPVTSEEIEFAGPGGATLRGWFFPVDDELVSAEVATTVHRVVA